MLMMAKAAMYCAAVALVALLLVPDPGLCMPSLLSHDHTHPSAHVHHGEHHHQDDDYFDADSDRSYSFAFSADGYDRSEASDADGSVIGSYTYVDASGNKRLVKYRAGADIGFVIEEDAIIEEAQEPQVKTSKASAPAPVPVEKKGYSYEAPAIPAQLYGPPPMLVVPTKEEKKEEVLETEAEAQAAPVAEVEHAPIFFQQPEVNMDDWTISQSYAFGYKTSETHREESSDVNGFVRGAYTTLSEDGSPIVIKYKAGPGIGFVIENQEALIKSAGIPEPVEKLETPVIKTSPVANAAPLPLPVDSIPVEVEDYYDDDADASYAFAYAGADSDRREEADSEGNVRGHYSYINAEGHTILVKYIAGPGIGFQVLNEEELSQTVREATLDGAAAVKSQIEVQEQIQVPVAPVVKTNAIPIIVPVAAPPAPAIKVEEHVQQDVYYDDDADASYAFAYTGSDGDRQEGADSDGNIRGQYSYVNPEGHTILVKYIAGPGIGFKILNEEELSQTVEKATLDGAAALKTKISAEVEHPSAPVDVKTNAVPVVIPVAAPPSPTIKVEESAQEDDYFDENADASYSFAYAGTAGDRQEEADSEGNVKGQYSYVNAQGNQILVRYIAGPGIGFKILNEDELSQSVHQATLDGADAIESAPVTPAHPTPAVSQVYSHTAQETAPVAAPLPLKPDSTGEIDYHDEDSDKSYSFLYQNEDAHRQEVSDPDGNVQGRYSYINAEGNTIIVKYIAGPGSGFQILNEEELNQSVQKATQEAAEILATVKSAPQQAAVAPSSPVRKTNVRIVKKKKVKQPASSTFTNFPTATIKATLPKPQSAVVEEPDYFDENADASYAFAYKDASGNRKEESDADGNVRGQYSYVNAEGHEILVKYIAGPGIGFQIVNEEDLAEAVDKATLAAAAEAPTVKLADQSSVAIPIVPPVLHQIVAPPAPIALAAPQPVVATRRKIVKKGKRVKKPLVKSSGSGSSASASFNFAYAAEGHNQEESSDAYGERLGSYSYVTPEGRKITVTYKAGKNGFEILDQQDVLVE